MPGTTTNLGLRYPTATDAPDGPGAVQNLATDVEDRFGRTAATVGALAAGTRYGQRAVVGAVEYRWNGSAWQAWESNWTAYTPTFSGLSGTGSSNVDFRWRYSAGEVEVRGSIAFGGSDAPNGGVSFSLPVNQTNVNSTWTDLLQFVTLKSGAGDVILGSAGFVTSGTAYINFMQVNGSSSRGQNLSATVPFTWNSSSWIDVRMRYSVS